MALNSLPLFHRIAGTRVVVVGTSEMAEAKRRLVERAGGICCGEPEAHHSKLAFVALDDAREAEAVAARLRSKGLLVNVADRPDLCEFTTPSILDREPVLIAVGTGGASAGLAKQLRLRLEALLPQSLGALAKGLSEARDSIRARFPSGNERRRALDGALRDGGTLDPLDSGSAGRISEWLDGAKTTTETGQVTITLTSGDPDDLTLRQARLLGCADVLLYNAAVPAAILDRARADALRRALPYDGEPRDGLTVILEIG